MLYRIWGVCRRPLVKAWEVRNEVAWDKARPGSSALSAAYERGFDAEVATHNKEQVGTTLWDFAKIFDYIDGDLLYQTDKERDTKAFHIEGLKPRADPNDLLGEGRGGRRVQDSYGRSFFFYC